MKHSCTNTLFADRQVRRLLNIQLTIQQLSVKQQINK